MNSNIRFNSFYLVFLLFIVFSGCQSPDNPARNISVTPLFTDNMVLQQKRTIPVWGKAEPRGEVSVALNGQNEKAIADNDGKWRVNLAAIPAGGPYELLISGEESISIKNVMVGEVWICSGQSNMEMALAGWGEIDNYEEEVRNAKYPNIRLLTVDKATASQPQEDFNSDGWKECNPENVALFSAVAYFFGRDLYQNLNVPVGLIHTSWGGTLAEVWTSGPTLKTFPEFAEEVKMVESDTLSNQAKILAREKKKAEWPDKIEQILVDKGTLNHGFQDPGYKSDNWQTMALPTLWEDTGLNVDGVVWFSKEVNIPESWKGEDLVLSLGKINDYDITWFNGVRVGRGIDVSDLRNYNIPNSIVVPGKNKIVVEVLDIGNMGGMYGPADEMKLESAKGSVPLTGEWSYKIDPINIDIGELPRKPDDNSEVNRPTVLYNAMINPLLPYGIQGAIWYQGESNADRAYQYRKLFQELIGDWRKNWGQGDFPFLFVQLANFMEVKSQPEEDAWAELREAQSMALELPNTGMAVAIDIGDEKDIHPKNKQDVGRRLALNALAKVYDRDIAYSGPIYKSMKIEEGKVRLQFNHADGGLKIKEGDQLKGFAIAGDNKKFVWAEAKIDGDEIVVWNPNIPQPVSVRYAWASNPVCNLYNGAGLPASPFRTDSWEGLTFDEK